MAIRYLPAVAVVAALLMASSGYAPPQNEVQATSTPTGPAVAYSLLTHCGISEARVGQTYFFADKPLDDGNGNTPSGWGNTYQEVTMTVEGQNAVFRDDRGHNVTVNAWPGATGFPRACS
ncbi:hypothetical protein [Arthrobacter sp. NyZ413]|uniref:hypothetical protein n=1 Tax=Arthrobacter sp. NyZ413 TaxID=3144669 RepID=UPI003BF9232D